MQSRGLVSTSNRALPSCADAKGEGATPMLIAASDCTCAKLQRCCHIMLCFEVGDGFDAHAGGAGPSNLARICHDSGGH